MSVAFIGLPIPNPLDLFKIPFDVAKSVATRAAKEIFEMIASLLLSGVGWLFSVVWGFIDRSTTPNLYDTWFAGGPFAIVLKLAGMLLMMAVALAIAEAIWNRDSGELVRSVIQYFPKAMFMLTSLLFVTTIGLALADAITAWMLDTVAYGANDFADSLLNVDNAFNYGLGLVVVMIAALVMIIVLLIVALELVVREGFIFVLVAITAIAQVADVYRPARGAGGRAGRLLAGVIAMKPIIALCFAIGAAALGAAASGSADPPISAVPEPGEAAEAADPEDPLLAASDRNTLAVVLAGLATMSLAAITPFTVLRLFPWEGTEATEGSRSAMSSPVKAAAGTAAIAATGGAGAAGAGGAAAAGVGGAAVGQAASTAGSAPSATAAASRAS